jgi:formamidopyrimidine-DNA glycosylase
MPELPEVQTVVNTLRPRLLGQRINAVYLARADIVHPKSTRLASCLPGETIRSIDRRGKRIVVTLNSDNRFYFHLGMSGRLTIEPPTAPKLPHTHLILEISGIHVRFRDPRRFGGVFWLGMDPDDDEKIGPEPLELNSGQLAARLSKTTRAVKNALLDQSVVAGLGNIYVDESLFHARIHPLRRACDLTPTEIARLNRAIKTVLKRALRHRGSTLRDYIDAEGNAGEFQNLHRVYARESQPCTSCRSPIRRIVLGGRSTHFCSICQLAGRQSPGKLR